MNHRNYLCLMGLLLFALLLCTSCSRRKQVYLENSEILEVTETDAETCDSKRNQEETKSVIFVCGAVLKPGVYELPQGARICDAFRLAGGLLPEASASYWNQAEILTDGMKLYVPTEDELVTDAFTNKEENTSDGRIDINKADKDQLMQIPGVGATRAEQILAYRRENGVFSSIEDVKKVSGIKEGVFEKMREYIKVE